MNTKLFVIGLIVIAAIIFAVIFANQFAFNQTEIANMPVDVTTNNGDEAVDIDEEVDLAPETTEGLPTSTDSNSLESDLDNLDLSGLDLGLDDLNVGAEGL
ncbi:MAG: hypothetical protein Q8P83_01045 [bacterium]|nr:hypothetical protein [bacterium]